MKHFLLAALFLAVSSQATFAEHALIKLEVYHLDPASNKVKGHKDASADEEPPLGGVNPRPVLRVKAKDPLLLIFTYTNTYPHGEVPDACVRYYVAALEKSGQKTLPDFKEAVTQGRFDVNFKPGSKVGAQIRFRLNTPGIYLLRVQSERTKSDHEHFAAIELKVE